jgi:hypothetical protein
MATEIVKLTVSRIKEVPTQNSSHPLQTDGTGYEITFENNNYDTNRIWRHFGLPIDNPIHTQFRYAPTAYVSLHESMMPAIQTIVTYYLNQGKIGEMSIVLNQSAEADILVQQWTNRDENPFYLYMCTTKDMMIIRSPKTIIEIVKLTVSRMREVPTQNASHPLQMDGTGYEITFENNYDTERIWRHFGLPINNPIYSRFIDSPTAYVSIHESMMPSNSIETIVTYYLNRGKIGEMAIVLNQSAEADYIVQQWTNRDETQPFYLYMCTTRDMMIIRSRMRFQQHVQDYISPQVVEVSYRPDRMYVNGIVDSEGVRNRYFLKDKVLTDPRDHRITPENIHKPWYYITGEKDQEGRKKRRSKKRVRKQVRKHKRKSLLK